jgi:hypothetical protein
LWVINYNYHARPENGFDLENEAGCRETDPAKMEFNH